MLGTGTQEEMRRSFAEGIPCGFRFEDKSGLAICPNGDVYTFEPMPKTINEIPKKKRPARAETWLEENEKTIARILDEAGNRGWTPTNH